MSLAAKVKPRVRTQWLALAAAAVVLAGVLVAWGLQQAADRVQVVRLGRDVPAGAQLTNDDLGLIGVAYDVPVKGLVPAASLDRLVGRTAAYELHAESLVQVGMWRDAIALGAGEQSVGAVLGAGRFPAELTEGDIAVASPLAADPTVAPVEVRVISTDPTDDGRTRLTLAVPAVAAVTVAQLAATDQLVLVGRPMVGGA